ncbi:hypothetical protein [Ruixingdingia sedimenti]|uniref:Uncharacterized protein n=1 Tax=Ruixingdingia sedimenti TaxID=3073604 RepID=A0ABU1FBB2_9RHOB|nr:hypothetical protein [Xinfangfangia sp. LG-4]MDR5654156.1 hypothetical protein [Xinfangfangia sp. LG-4]
MAKIWIAAAIVVLGLAALLVFGGIGNDGGEAGQDSANPHAIQQE